MLLPLAISNELGDGQSWSIEYLGPFKPESNRIWREFFQYSYSSCVRLAKDAHTFVRG